MTKREIIELVLISLIAAAIVFVISYFLRGKAIEQSLIETVTILIAAFAGSYYGISRKKK